MMAKFSKAMHFLLITWLIAMVLQTVGRLVFFISFLPGDFLAHNQVWEIIRVFLLGMREDSSVAAILLMPAFIAAFLLLFEKFKLNWWMRGARYWRFIVLLVLVLMILIKHYFFYYYQSLFNVFFWEFWLNWENSKLVIWSLFDELPMLHLSLFLILFIVLWYGLVKTSARLLPKMDKSPFLNKKYSIAVWVVLALVASRGTFDMLPLNMQDFRGLVSDSPHLSFSYANPLYALDQSWNANFSLSLERKREMKQGLNWNKYRSDFLELKKMDSNRIINIENKKQASVEYLAPSVFTKYLKRKPRHIVILFMESYFAWPLDFPDVDFRTKIAANMIKLKSQGIYFDEYFQAAAGTIENITKAVLGIPTPKDSPNDYTFTEAFKPFPGTMPRMAKDLGYRPRFFYGGSLAWHNLQYFMEKSGFEDIYGENALQHVEKQRFGLHDDYLYQLLDRKLRQADQPTFDYVMTLSNHPPYQLPEEFKSDITEIPEELKPHVTDDHLFFSRFRAFSYADKALGRFFERARKSPYFKDTLFVLTADHSFHAPFKWPTREEYIKNKIPLLFYAPDLLKGAPQVIHTRGSHFDLVPTIISLVSDDPKPIHHWGHSLFDGGQQDILFSFRLDCLQKTCFFQNRGFTLDENDKFVPCPRGKCTNDIKLLKKDLDAFEESGLYYLINNTP